MLTAVGVLLAACALFGFEQWEGDRAGLERNQSRLIEVLGSAVANDLARGDESAVRGDLAGLAHAPQVLQAAASGMDGRVVASFGAPPARTGWTRPMNPVRVPVVYHGRQVGSLTLRLGSEGIMRFLPRYLAITGALFFAATGMALFLGRGLARRVIEPVDRLSWAMRDVAESQDFVHRVAKVADDEFGRLTDCFNHLLSNLQQNHEELQAAMTEVVEARDAAETANVMKSQFLANISHEIRTPLNGVLAMAQVLAMSDLSAEQSDRLRVIKTSGESLLAILDDLLDVAKIEAGALTLDERAFDLTETVESAFAALRLSADVKGLDANLEIEPGAAGLRFGDPARLRQIMSNLLSNALKFTTTGQVSLRVSDGGPGGGEGLHLIVADTGVGIPENKLPLLFQKFVQLDGSSTRRFGGAGLGLSICQELTALMGGEIWAESIEGEGSAFHVVVPLAKVENPTPADPGRKYAEEEGEIAPLRILAAEDNPTNQLVLSTILQIFQADVTMVADGAAAVEAWREKAFDVILMDIQMPIMDGVSACRAIRSEEAAQGRVRTPIYAVTANAMADQVAEYIAVGMDGYVAKPIEVPKLQMALEAALAANAAQEAA